MLEETVGDVGEVARGEVVVLPPGRSVDLSVTLEVSDAREGRARESSG